jgi:hypothetical protein
VDQVQNLIVLLTRLADWLWPFAHPKEVVAALLNDSVGLLLDVWFKFILRTTDFETGGDFTAAAAIRHFEPVVQVTSDFALVLVAIWASYRVMWGQGAQVQYAARTLLPRLLLGLVLINFALPMFQAAVATSNALCDAIGSFGTIGDPSRWWAGLVAAPNTAAWQIVTTALLAAGYDVLAIAYLVRYAVLIVLAITAPLAGLLFMLPETDHWSRLWATTFVSNLLMQPAQLFVLSIGFALESSGHTPVHHLFALASLLIVFKVPGALGSSEKVAHKLQSTLQVAFRAVEHAVAHAA